MVITLKCKNHSVYKLENYLEPMSQGLIFNIYITNMISATIKNEQVLYSDICSMIENSKLRIASTINIEICVFGFIIYRFG